MSGKSASTSKSGNNKGADFRRADNGRYTTAKYAETHSRTTIKETRKK